MAVALPQSWQPHVCADPSELVDPVESARAAGLRYVSDLIPGIRRLRVGKGFRYTASDGRPIRDAETLGRIKRLAIPPAWTDVWICPDPRGHLQATGRDARGRKQYRYHPRWREVRDAVKYDRMLAFAEALPKTREHTDRDLERPGLPRDKVLATVVRLLEETRIRIGNDEYRKENGSYGLTTLRNRHVNVIGAEVRFSFRGKSGKHHSIDLHDRRMARIIKRFLEIPGQELFKYVDHNGEVKAIDSACGRSPARISPPKISAPGPAPFSPRDSYARRLTLRTLGEPRSRWFAPSPGSLRSSATRPPSQRRVTSILR
jgi:DNA topoisomerase-1